jgi:hypothetical protein
MGKDAVSTTRQLNSSTTATKCAVDLTCLIGVQESIVNSIIQKDVAKTKSKRYKGS